MALTKVGKEGITGISNSSDATAITIDSSENVGVGTTTPSNVSGVPDLTVAGKFYTSDGTSSNPAHSFTGDTNTGVFRPSDDALCFSTGGTERVRVADTKFLTSQKHVEHAKALGNVQREVVGFYEANMSTSYNTIFTVGTGNIHLGYFYEVIMYGGDWGGHSAARAYKKGFINGYNGYTGHSSIEQSGVHSGAQIIENVTWTGTGNDQVSNYQLKLNTGSVGARIYVRLVGTINTFTITN